jgi:hypothetical protein
MVSLQKSASRSAAKTTLERSDDDPKGVFFILYEQKTHKKWGGVLYNYLYPFFKPHWYQVS